MKQLINPISKIIIEDSKKVFNRSDKSRKKLTLVTGAGGLLGYAIRQLAPKDTDYITRSDGDLTDFAKTKKIFQKIKPNQVIHLAAEVAGIGGNMMHSRKFFRDNIMININIFEAARINGVDKLISFMSTCVFPDKCKYPLNEKDIQSGPPHPSNFGYAYAKRMLEVQSAAYRKEWGCNFIVAIPTNIYGENDFWNLEDGHVIPSLIHKCFLAKKNKEDFIVWGSGRSLREFVYSQDVAKLILWAIDEYNEESPIIFTNSKESSIKDLVDLVVKEVGFKGKVIFDITKPEGQFRKPSDNSKLKKYLPNFKFTPLDKGIKNTVEWFIKNHPNVRM